MRTIAATLLLAITGTVAGCEHRESGQPPLTPASSDAAMTPASRTTPAAERGAESVTRALCERAERCGEVGPNALYASNRHCLDALWVDSIEQLSPCRTGVDREALRECLAEIGEHGCDDPMGGFQQYLACKVEDLCL